jgi:hypothetical protein
MARYSLWIFLAVLLAAAQASADVYVWTDADGVRHYSNTPPPEDAVILKTYEETPPGPAPQAPQPAEAPPAPAPAPSGEAPKAGGDGQGKRVPVGELAEQKAREKKAAELLEKESKRLSNRLQELNQELERVQTEQYRGSSYDDEELVRHFELIQAEIRKEIEQSNRRVEEIKKKYGIR